MGLGGHQTCPLCGLHFFNRLYLAGSIRRQRERFFDDAFRYRCGIAASAGTAFQQDSKRERRILERCKAHEADTIFLHHLSMD